MTRILGGSDVQIHCAGPYCAQGMWVDGAVVVVVVVVFLGLYDEIVCINKATSLGQTTTPNNLS